MTLKEVQELVDNLSPEERELINDQYHNFKELYEFRKMYNAALFNEWAKVSLDWLVVEKPDGTRITAKANPALDTKETLVKFNVHKSWKHNDGELCFGGGWFIVVAVLPTGQISNHYPASDWDLFQVPIVEKALFKYDNHTGKDVLDRLKNL